MGGIIAVRLRVKLYFEKLRVWSRHALAWLLGLDDWLLARFKDKQWRAKAVLWLREYGLPVGAAVGVMVILIWLWPAKALGTPTVVEQQVNLVDCPGSATVAQACVSVHRL